MNPGLPYADVECEGGRVALDKKNLRQAQLGWVLLLRCYTKRINIQNRTIIYSDHVESKNINSIFGKTLRMCNNRDTLQRFGGNFRRVLQIRRNGIYQNNLLWKLTNALFCIFAKFLSLMNILLIQRTKPIRSWAVSIHCES